MTGDAGVDAAIDVNDSRREVAHSVHTDATVPVVVLVGVPGAGKTTVGRALADRLGVAFRDTDADVEAAAGRTIADIFVESGEPEFRRLEAEAVGRAVSEHTGVLALGGGAVMDPRTRALLAEQPVVWLRVGLAAASQRAGLGVARPVLLGNVRAQMKALMDARAPLYAEVATLVVDTDALAPDQAVESIVSGLGLGTGSGSQRTDAPRTGAAVGDARREVDGSGTAASHVGHAEGEGSKTAAADGSHEIDARSGRRDGPPAAAVRGMPAVGADVPGAEPGVEDGADRPEDPAR